MSHRTLLAALVLGTATLHAQARGPVVTVAEGSLRGVDTAGVIAFFGVPYAAPPVGDLRWQPPQPAARWSVVRSAERLGKNCMQGQPFGDIDPFAAGVSEDCLYLNVWTARTEGRRAPVMVWIHGGGFYAGFGGEERHHGGVLARKGAVVVTLNYRLGPFGFLAHPALAEGGHGAGNYGLLDQIAALEWVKRNIARFGGDPARVTIFGESAGAASVGFLVASPLAKGLFHRAILESGAGIGRAPARPAAEAEGVRFAEALGIRGTGAEAAARLRAVPADSVLAAMQGRGPDGRPAMLARQPVLDGRVLPRSVDSALATGRANLVPVIVGSNADEGDAPYGAPARSFARLVTGRGQKAWMYRYTRVGEDSASRRRGAYHSSEITFVFGRPRPIREDAGRTPYDSTLADAMSDYWVAFAASGDPNGEPASAKWGRWPAYDPGTDAHMELGPQIAARRGFPRAAVYDSLDRVGRGRGEVRP